MPVKPKTAAIYARYSSDLQKDRSIPDQVALCESYAKREGLKVVAHFADRAKSGTSMHDRDGLEGLRNAAKAGAFDTVVVESSDRLSRDQEHLAYLYKRMTHYGVIILTVNEGRMTDIHVGVRGIVNSFAIKDLASKIKRGQNGLVAEGKVPGTVTYGYRRIIETLPNGLKQFKPGAREIDPEQAANVRRIFEEYADGKSPRDIAAGLTADRVPAPSGRAVWNHQSLMSGGGKKRGGILGNALYTGVLTWNQHSTVRDPDTGGETRRARPVNDHLIVQVPELRIVSQGLWERAQAVRTGRAAIKFGPAGVVMRRSGVTHGKHILSGLLKCAVCNGPMIVNKLSLGKRYAMCSDAFQKGLCSHRRSYVMDKIRDRVFAGLKDELTDPALFADVARAHAAEYAAEQKKNAVALRDAERQRSKVVAGIDRLVSAIEGSDEPVSQLMEKLKTREAERVALTERIRLLSADNVVTLHPNVVDDYLATITQLHKALSDNPNAAKNHMALRNVIDCIVVHPTPYRADYGISVFGRLSAIMGVDLFPTMRSNKEILAEEGVSCGENVYPD
jgi:DNA invertase Pin-like site-specific DNA recombinase